MRTSRYAIVVMLLFIGWGQAEADTEIFRWVDADGVVHYSDRPLDPAATSTGMRSRRTDQNQVREKELRGWEQEQASREEAQEDAEQDAFEANRRAEEERMQFIQCEAAKERLEVYTTAPRLFETMPNGERRYLSEEELDAARQGAADDIDTWCK